MAYHLAGPRWIESLETRRLLAAAYIHFGVVYAHGESNLPNTIVVAKSADQLGVDVSITSVNKKGITNTIHKNFPFSLGVTGISILGGSKDDVITVGQGSGGFAIATTILAGGGNDAVTCGPEDDSIQGNSGNDVIIAGDGNNTVRGMSGNDSIITGSGNDRIDGSTGNDTINSGAGNDTVRGGSGNDIIDAGSGDDLVFGEAGRDVITGGDGNDILWGGAGDDSVSGGNGNDTLGGVSGTNILMGGPGHDNFVVKALSKDPANDYNSAEDTITIGKKDGANPPKIV